MFCDNLAASELGSTIYLLSPRFYAIIVTLKVVLYDQNFANQRWLPRGFVDCAVQVDFHSHFIDVTLLILSIEFSLSLLFQCGQDLLAVFDTGALYQLSKLDRK